MTVPDDLSALDEKPLADAERMVDDCEPNAEILRREGIPPKTRYIPADKR